MRGPSAREGTPTSELLKQTASRTVERWLIDGVDCYAKTFRSTGFAERLRELLRGPHARWEANRIALATSRGIPTATVVAVGWNDDRVRAPESMLVTRGLPGVMPLSQLRTRYELPGSTVKIDDRNGLIDAVADLLALLHARGLQHGDLHAGNVVVRRDADGWRAWLIDLTALRTSLRSGDCFDNLARFDYSLLFTPTNAERRRFFRRYWSRLVALNPTVATRLGSTRRRVLARCVATGQQFVDRVVPTVDAAWSRGHRKVVEIPNGVGLASLGREWLTEFVKEMPETWKAAKPQALSANHRVVRHETPFGVRMLRVIRFPVGSTVTARQTWDATHAALRRGVVAVVPWLCFETDDAGYLVCCQPEEAQPQGATGRLTTPDGRWSGIAAVEQFVPSSAKPRSRHAAALLLAVMLMTLSGCGWLNRQQPTGLPARHTVKAEQLVVQSDIKLPKNHPLIKDLDSLRQEIARTLKLPLQEQPVTVYLFSDELRYAQYLQVAFPNLPPRRAYFVGTPDELAVYTFWGEKIQEDLRHEYTHGVLHATLKDVPLWLDEGLAEYFEVTSQPRGLNGEYVTRLADALNNGWQPDLKRLEQIDSVSQMQKGDYLEAWAWVHFMLHDSDTGRDVLLAYLADLRDTAQPGRLSERLTAALPAADDRFRAYAATLKPDVRSASHARD